LGIEEEVKSRKEDYGLSLYPNPFRSILTITSSSGVDLCPARRAEIRVDIYNTSGQLVKSIKGFPPIHWKTRDENPTRDSPQS